DWTMMGDDTGFKFEFHQVQQQVLATGNTVSIDNIDNREETADEADVALPKKTKKMKLKTPQTKRPKAINNYESEEDNGNRNDRVTTKTVMNKKSMDLPVLSESRPDTNVDTGITWSNDEWKEILSTNLKHVPKIAKPITELLKKLEGWYQHNIWSPLIDPAFRNWEIDLIRGEGMSRASSDRKNGSDDDTIYYLS
ncbi:339_t:CDS:2, partial [Paraglomus occultum]